MQIREYRMGEDKLTVSIPSVIPAREYHMGADKLLVTIK